MSWAASRIRWLPALLLVVAVSHPLSGDLSPPLHTVLTVDPLTKLDALAQHRVTLPGSSRVIVRASESAPATSLRPIIDSVGGTITRTLTLINAQVADVPNAALLTVAASPRVERISLDRRIVGAMERTGGTIHATTVRESLGFDGSGVGVAVIDSGVSFWHDDLAGSDGASRVRHFVDLVNGNPDPYDDYGHGSHVAGIVAGNGFDSSGARAGIAPGAHLVVLKVLDASGHGGISTVIAALERVVAVRSVFNIRVVNLSVAAGVYESFDTDPLTLAARKAVEAGIVVVAAAGNRGRDAEGHDAYGGVTAPGNAPWVLTVGASSHQGTTERADDVMTRFSSRGPGAVDYAAKPDVVAPGMGIESLSDPTSDFYITKSAYLLDGTVPRPYLPYLSLSGTSMAAPVVAGTVALMLQANAALTPNQVKAILQYTSEMYDGYDPLTQGAGFLNAKGAVELAQFFASPSSDLHPVAPDWSRRVIWGNRMYGGGWFTADASAWDSDVTWGDRLTTAGQDVTLGLSWKRGHNVVWGSACGGANCDGPWTVEGVSGDESVVWRTEDGETVVWGTSDDESVVWGTNCGDPACEPELWPHP